MNVIFEILYLFSVLYLLLLYYSLFKNVVLIRRKTKTSLGIGTKELERAVRAHSNFCETVPIFLFLSLILYFNNYNFICFLAILFLCAGRKIHASSISDLNENLQRRRLGMKLTVTSYFFIIVGILYYISNIIYFAVISQTTYTTNLPQVLIIYV